MQLVVAFDRNVDYTLSCFDPCDTCMAWDNAICNLLRLCQAGSSNGVPRNYQYLEKLTLKSHIS